jgi:hypothetical protein
LQSIIENDEASVSDAWKTMPRRGAGTAKTRSGSFRSRRSRDTAGKESAVDWSGARAGFPQIRHFCAF